MKRILIKLIAVAVLVIAIKGSALIAQEEVAFGTITEALECVYTNQHEVRKLIIMDEIAGNDYLFEFKGDAFQSADTTIIYRELGKIFICDEIVNKLRFINSTFQSYEISTISIEGPDADLFTYTTLLQPPAILESGDTLVIDITFNPTGSTLGEKTAFLTLTLTSDTVIRVIQYALTAEIVEGITATPNLLDFGNIESNKIYTKEIELKSFSSMLESIKTGYLLKNTDFKLETNLENTIIYGTPSIYISINSDVEGEITDILIIITEYKYCYDTLIVPIRAFNVDGILEIDVYEISIVPNPTENDFTITFENPDAQMISVELLDISGKNILDIFNGFAETGTQIYKVNLPLPSGTYFIKFVINDKPVIRNVIVK